MPNAIDMPNKGIRCPNRMSTIHGSVVTCAHFDDNEGKDSAGTSGLGSTTVATQTQ